MSSFGGAQVALPANFPVHTSIGPVASLPIVNAIVSPDGFTKSAVLAGNSLPGPVIVGQKGDNFLINVTNYLTDDTMLTGTTIHWHGIAQHNHNHMDGSAYVTQCPIAPEHSFLYNFTAGQQAGTFWYHSHYGAQYCDGLRGSLVIYDPDDPYRSSYDVDDESTIITLMDWYHDPSPVVHRQIFPASVLINGVGCYDHDHCENPHAIIHVEPTKRYRFRLLNMACKPNYLFSIDGHDLTVIEVDGNLVVPYTVDAIPIHAAQRYSFILDANRPIDNYWVRAVPNQPIDASTRAILRYADAPARRPLDKPMWSFKPLRESELRPLAPVPPRLLQPEPDVKIHLEMSKNMTDFNFLINGAQYTPPTVPVLLQLLNGAISPMQIEPRGSVYVLPKDRVVEITFSAKDSPGRPHPFHLHGHSFAVIKSADSARYDYTRPVVRDTVSTGMADDVVVVRFVTDNPGPWMLHCHNEWHLYAGMSIVFAEDVQGVRDHVVLDDASRALCPYRGPPQDFPLPPPSEPGP